MMWSKQLFKIWASSALNDWATMAGNNPRRKSKAGSVRAEVFFPSLVLRSDQQKDMISHLPWLSCSFTDCTCLSFWVLQLDCCIFTLCKWWIMTLNTKFSTIFAVHSVYTNYSPYSSDYFYVIANFVVHSNYCTCSRCCVVCTVSKPSFKFGSDLHHISHSEAAGEEALLQI